MTKEFEENGPSRFCLTPGTGLPPQCSSPCKGELPEVRGRSGISLKAIGRDLGLEVSVRGGELLTHPLPSMASSQQMMWRKSLTINSDFCRAVVQTGYLTWQQMLDAVCRYRLGATLQGHVIFWQIDREERICDGKIMCYNPDCHRSKDKSQATTWVSALLAKRHGGKNDGDITRHCLFGLHLLHPRNAWLVEQSISACGNEPPRATNSSSNADAAFAQKCHTTDDWQQRPRLATNDGCEILRGESPASQAAFAQRCHTTDDWQQRPSLATNDGCEILRGESPASQAVFAQRCHTTDDCQQRPVAVVEAEKTAVILSAHYPQYIWLATGGLGEVQPEKFRPLRGRKVILFPDTDPDGKAFNYWYQAAQTVMAQPYWEGSPPIRVSALLEQHATPEQKQLKIDLVDYLFN